MELPKVYLEGVIDQEGDFMKSVAWAWLFALCKDVLLYPNRIRSEDLIQTSVVDASSSRVLQTMHKGGCICKKCSMRLWVKREPPPNRFLDCPDSFS